MVFLNRYGLLMKRIMVQKLSYRYPDGTQALNDISFEVTENQRVAVIGHNGSGKSTLLCILSALLLPTSGIVQINDSNVTHKNKILIRKSTGILFSQVEYQFIMPDIINDVMLSINNGEDEEKYLQAMDIIKQVNLADVAFHHPLSLSSGQMKRAALASVLAKNPSVLLLDEPLANLDKPSSDAVIDILLQLTIPIVFATHSKYLVEHVAQRIIVLEKGTIVMDDTAKSNKVKKYLQTILT